MKLNKLAAAVAVVALTAVATQANAANWNYVTGTSSSFAGVTDVTFDAPFLAPLGTVSTFTVYNAINGNATYDKGAVYDTSSVNVTAMPFGTTGRFWSVGSSPAAQVGPGTVAFSGAASTGVKYYGFLWGSSDTYNDVTFNLSGGGTLVLNGSQVPSGTGNQGMARYVNVFADTTETITGVSFASTGNAFETDNHAYSVTAVPEPESYAMMLAGLGLMGAIARRRKSKSV